MRKSRRDCVHISHLMTGVEMAWTGWTGLGSEGTYGIKRDIGWLVDPDQKSIMGRFMFLIWQQWHNVLKPIL